MALTKIVAADYNDKGVIGLPDSPGLSTSEMQNKFEEISKDVIIPKHNALIDELEASTGASNIGTTTSNVQSELNALSNNIHTHANKALLDTYTQTESDLASAVSLKHSHTNKTLLDSYTQTETDIADAVTKKHAHTNKTLLDSYTQTETDLADSVSKKHSHSNKALLDTYDQTNANITSAISEKHTHSNKALLDTYDQTNADITSAINNNHTHTNKSVIDALSKDSSTGKLMFEGSTISGSGSTVSWQQNTTSGTKIAEITIDGSTTDVYAPTSGGGGGTTDYSALTSKPKINNVELAGNKTSAQLGLADASTTYTKIEVDGLVNVCVPDTRSVNGHVLNADVTVTASDVGLGNVGNFKAVSTVASQGLSSTEQSNARDNIGAGTYSKPSSGIPQSDLDTSVSTKLSKLDYTSSDYGKALKVKNDGSTLEWGEVSSEFVGTQAEWNALSSTEKAKYLNKIVNITDDYTPSASAVTSLQNSISDLNTEISTINGKLGYKLLYSHYEEDVSDTTAWIQLGDSAEKTYTLSDDYSNYSTFLIVIKVCFLNGSTPTWYPTTPAYILTKESLGYMRTHIDLINGWGVAQFNFSGNTFTVGNQSPSTISGVHSYCVMQVLGAK